MYVYSSIRYYIVTYRALFTDIDPPLNEMDARFNPKLSQIGPKWDKPETFSDQISVLPARTFSAQI